MIRLQLAELDLELRRECCISQTKVQVAARIGTICEPERNWEGPGPTFVTKDGNGAFRGAETPQTQATGP